MSSLDNFDTPASAGASAGAAPGQAANDGANDAEIEALNLAPTARAAAYALKRAHPAVKFTSGRRDKAAQAHAMAGNVVSNREWITETYKASPLCQQCQDWVHHHPGASSQALIAQGLLSVFDTASDADLASFSRHLAGMAFDVQPVQPDTGQIMKTIEQLAGLRLFLEKEGGLVRWHAEF